MREVCRSAREAEVKETGRVATARVLGRGGREGSDSSSLQAAGSGAGTGGTGTRRSGAGSSLATCPLPLKVCRRLSVICLPNVSVFNIME